MRNALDGRLEPAVRVMAVPECKGGETVACVSNGGGELTLPGNRTWTLDVQSDGLRLLVPSQSYGPSTVIQDVWVHRVISASGIVDVECPESAAKGTIRVAARPAFPRGWPRREATGEEAIGSPAWLEKRLGSRGFLWSAEVVDRRYSLEIPVLNSVTLVATAPGHISTVKSVDPDRMSGPGIEMNFLLRKGEVARVSVQDEDGIPIRGASLQFAATLTLSTKDVNLDELRLKRRAVNTGLTLREDGAKGVTHVAFIASTGTDKFGVAEAYHGFDAHSMVLMVTAIGHEPFIKRMEQSGEFSDARITLRKVTPARRGYRLSLHGRCASAGASLQLSEIVAELTLCLKPIKADENGVARVLATPQVALHLHQSLRETGPDSRAFRFLYTVTSRVGSLLAVFADRERRRWSASSSDESSERQ